jgi:hypothetical protein
MLTPIKLRRIPSSAPGIEKKTRVVAGEGEWKVRIAKVFK